MKKKNSMNLLKCEFFENFISLGKSESNRAGANACIGRVRECALGDEK